MKKTYFFVSILFIVFFAACGKYDESSITERLDDVEEKINANTRAIQALRNKIPSAIQQGLSMIVTQTTEGQKIEFSDGQTYVIAPGAAGDSGKDGKDGKDGTGIDISITQTQFTYIITIGDKTYTIDKTFAVILEQTKLFVPVKSSVSVAYSVHGGDESVMVFAETTDGYKAVVGENSISVTAPDTQVPGARIVVTAIENNTGRQASQLLSITDDDKVHKEKFAFSASESRYASLKERMHLTVSDADNAQITIAWGDGSTTKETVTGQKVFEHQYDTPGEYMVRVSSAYKSATWTFTVDKLLALSEATAALKNTKTVWFQSHRAHTSDPSIPENSVAAVNAAIAAGADVLETDTHTTSDGHVVICHDQTINATTNGTGNIPSMTLEKIKSYYLKDRNGNVTTEKMPTLEEFLLAARGRAYVNLDYSPRTASTAQCMEIVEKLGMVQQVLLYCNSAVYIRQVYAYDPYAIAYCRVDYWQTLLNGPYTYFIQARWKPNLPSDVVTDISNTEKAVAGGCVSSVNMLHVNDSKIPEYTINESYLEDLLTRYTDCHMIMNDCPDILVPMLRERGRHD